MGERLADSGRPDLLEWTALRDPFSLQKSEEAANRGELSDHGALRVAIRLEVGQVATSGVHIEAKELFVSFHFEVLIQLCEVAAVCPESLWAEIAFNL